MRSRKRSKRNVEKGKKRLYDAENKQKSFQQGEEKHITQ